MKQIFSGTVFEILPLNNGVMFSFVKEEMGATMEIGYKMLTFDGRFEDVTNWAYWITKFGNNYKSIVPLCENYIKAKALMLPNGRVFLMDNTGASQIVDADAVIPWSGELTYRGNAPSAIAIYKHSLWATYKQENVLMKYNIDTLREELRLGGKNSPFNQPNDIFLEGENAIISNSGSNTLLQLNLNSYSLFEIEKFNEPVYQYVKVDVFKFVLLRSGLYLMG